MVVGFDGLVNKELVASHVRVSVAHVVVIVDHNSASEAFVVFVTVVVGFAVLVSAILH